MAYTWKQKKDIMSAFIKDNYAGMLLNEGFVSYQDAGFNWYKVKNDLLYTVHMPIYSPGEPIKLRIGFGVVPLFSWEYIAYTCPMRDWGMEFQAGFGHYLPVVGTVPFEWEKKVLGSLPRQSWEDYLITNYAYEYKGMMIEHWIPATEGIYQKTLEAFNQLEPSLPKDIGFAERHYEYAKIEQEFIDKSRKGAEIFEEIVFPVLNRIENIKQVYEYNKLLKRMRYEKIEVVFRTEEEYLERLKDRTWVELSLTLVDQCLYFGDEKWYPAALEYLNHYKDFDFSFTPTAPKTKKEKADIEATKEHARTLIRVIETGDRELLKEEFEQNRERMVSQIREKLPNLKMEQ